jgi:diguanylate cyclase (GGDEF)-like protein/PAS domain S-box-containing protein
MPRQLRIETTAGATPPSADVTGEPDLAAPGVVESRSEELFRLAEAEDTFRAIANGEVDAFVVSEGSSDGRVFTLSTADRPYRMFVENMRDGAATLSSDGLILYANSRLAELVATSKDEIVGSPLSAYLEVGYEFRWDERIDVEGRGATVELNLVDSTGRFVPVLAGTSPLDVDGEHLTCLTFTDLTEQRAQDSEIARLSLAQAERLAELHAAQAALIKQATHDALTGLPNRALLVDRITQALSHSMRAATCTAVFFVDLDRFKHINDTRGHAAGDSVLRRVAEQLFAVVRPMDTVARIGGDEFVVLAPGIKGEQHAVDIGNRLLAGLRRPSKVTGMGERSDRVGASVGIAVSTGGRGTAESLLNEADTAMYHAKSLGGGRVVMFDSALGRQVELRSSAQHTLQSALDQRRIILHYQPVVDLQSGAIASFEALARIASHDGSILPPAAFIGAAEDSGLIVPLGTQVLVTACLEARVWRGTPAPSAGPPTVAVNLSARQFEPGDLAGIIRRALEHADLQPHDLHLELTETAIIDMLPDVMAQLAAITAMGVQVGLDDFGTGYASLTHLRRLPLSFVKIDQSFVQGLGVDDEDDRIVAAVVDLAANLGLRSIAEGVETDQQLVRLRELGCDQAQGFLFARPMPPHDVPTALATEPSWVAAS